jgi:hypothetical protein
MRVLDAMPNLFAARLPDLAAHLMMRSGDFHKRRRRVVNNRVGDRCFSESHGSSMK